MQIRQQTLRGQQRTQETPIADVQKSHIPNSAMLAMLENAPVQPEELSALSGSEHHPTQGLRDEIQARLGVNMPGLRIFEDQGLREQYNQQAYARGNEIHVAKGEYAPHTRSGMDLLMHEASHIVQQGSGIARGNGILQNSALEAQADLGMMAPSNFIMPTAATGNPIQGKGLFSRIKKSHQEAVDQFNEYEEDYRNMSRWERFKWTLKNPLARMTASSKKADTARRAGRTDAYTDTVADWNAGSYALEGDYGDPEGNIQQKKEGPPAWTNKGFVKAAPLASILAPTILNTQTTNANTISQAAKLGKTVDITNKDMGLGIAGGALTTIGSGVSAAANTTKAVNEAKKGNRSDAASSGLNAIGNVAVGLGGVAKMAAYGLGTTGAVSASPVRSFPALALCPAVHRRSAAVYVRSHPSVTGTT
ncbi:MAG: DUF4157 domain-containing protein [Oscillospiraceae bacterium]|nr:DUF4157 domain-containing protein [Oscillospiraceae bacterium]